MTKNYRNTKEIIDWMREKTGLGDYIDFSGISSFDVVTEKIDEGGISKAIIRAIKGIYELIFVNHISLSDIIILSDKKLEYLNVPNLPVEKKDLPFSNRSFFFTRFIIKNKGKDIFLVEPDSNKDFDEITRILMDKYLLDVKPHIVLYNGIGKFKGLEKPIVFLLAQEGVVKGLKSLKNKRKLYVGASRAKVLLKAFFYS